MRFATFLVVVLRRVVLVHDVKRVSFAVAEKTVSDVVPAVVAHGYGELHVRDYLEVISPPEVIPRCVHEALVALPVAAALGGTQDVLGDGAQRRRPRKKKAAVRVEALELRLHSGDESGPKTWLGDLGEESCPLSRLISPVPEEKRVRLPTFRQLEGVELEKHVGAVHVHQKVEVLALILQEAGDPDIPQNIAKICPCRCIP